MLRFVLLFLLAGVGTSCSTATGTAPAANVRQVNPDASRSAGGWRCDLPLARLFVPEAVETHLLRNVKRSGEALSIPLYLHFQGGPDTAEANFNRMECEGVLIASTLSGFSSAFRRPYEDPAAFAELLAAGEAALGERAGASVRFEPITITFFSAGYGAVREFLKEPRYFDRIQCLVSADSIYADIAAPSARAPRVEQMDGFLRFAQAAARGEKTFVLVHGMYPTEYASTSECADLLLASVAGTRVPAGWTTERDIFIDEEFHVSGFHLLTCDRDDAEIHVECLHMIPELIRRYTDV